MASAKVGNGSSWTATSSLRKLLICNCRSGLFHEVGGSKTTREHQGTNNSEVLLAKHNLQIWSSERTDCWQWETVYCYTFREYCKTLGTHAKFSSVYHPQSNGAVERANGLMFSGIKKCLFDQKKGKWVDELPRVIWSHNTTVSRATGFTPFRLLFGTEAMTKTYDENRHFVMEYIPFCDQN
jgi:hypothetical protein